MTPGISEEVGKVTTTTVDALKSVPVVLALVIFNVLFMFLITYAAVKGNEYSDKEMARWAELAKSCIKPGVP